MLFINGVWKEGESASSGDIDEAIGGATTAFQSWKLLSMETRSGYLYRFKQILQENEETLIQTISEEIGKPLWESRHEVESIKNKVEISIEAYKNRCPEITLTHNSTSSYTRAAPHGVVAVFGPFNFPGHLPHGHIIPALLAGNTIVFKPSEKAPKTAEILTRYWDEAGLPHGVLNLLQGEKEVAIALTKRKEVRGIFFTGSYNAGLEITKNSLPFPDRILALEMGGNNPLVVSTISNIPAAIFSIIQSAFITSGQRCTAARRLILIENSSTDELIQKLIESIHLLKVDYYTSVPEPYMGPVISIEAASSLLNAEKSAICRGGKVLVPLRADGALVRPGIIDMTGCEIEDEEYFGPFLQLIRVPDLESAVIEANKTAYGLSAALLSDSREEFQYFYERVRAGVINWNLPTTGASSKMPFGGLGKSGNFRPSGSYAADYSSYPISSQELAILQLPATLPNGMHIP